MSQVFLSYRHVPPDEKLAEGLCAFLEERGLRVFLDKQLRVGLEWAAEIDRQLRASDSFVVLLSEDSIRSDMVRQEVKIAHELRQEDGPAEMLFALLHAAITGGADLPVELSSDDPGVVFFKNPTVVAERKGVPLPAAYPRIVMETGRIRPINGELRCRSTARLAGQD